MVRPTHLEYFSLLLKPAVILPLAKVPRLLLEWSIFLLQSFLVAVWSCDLAAVTVLLWQAAVPSAVTYLFCSFSSLVAGCRPLSLDLFLLFLFLVAVVAGCPLEPWTIAWVWCHVLCCWSASYRTVAKGAASFVCCGLFAEGASIPYSCEIVYCGCHVLAQLWVSHLRVKPLPQICCLVLRVSLAKYLVRMGLVSLVSLFQKP